MRLLSFSFLVFFVAFVSAQMPSSDQAIFRIDKSQLAGENLTLKQNKDDPSNAYYQAKVYDGEELAVFLVALSNVSNEFESFPLEEFIFWINGKARVEPSSGEVFEIHAGDYFIQPKGFKGTFNFVGGDPYHLELAVVSKTRANAEDFSPINKAMVVSRDIISGASKNHTDSINSLYKGVELTLDLVRKKKILFQNNPQERIVHVLNGVLAITPQNQAAQLFYPGDFFILPKGFNGSWESEGFQALRTFQVYGVKD
ncbi:MAG: cupin domain-containing protein [Bacteroidota bacterium]